MNRTHAPACLLLLLPIWCHAQDKSADKSRVETDVVYGKGGEQELKLDIAVPKEGQGPFPAVLCIHTGAWRGGKRSDLSSTIRQFAARGFVAATIQYHLNPFPAPIEDCKCAVRFLRANAEKYRIDPERIGALGFSGGGHLACLLGLTTPADGLEGQWDLTAVQTRQSSRVQAVCSFFAPTDFSTNDWKPEVQPVLTNFFGGTFVEKKDLYIKASPITHVRKDPANAVFLFFHGTADPLVHYDQSVRLARALKGVGAAAQLVTMDGEKHGWSGEKLRQSVNQMMEFFELSLNNKK